MEKESENQDSRENEWKEKGKSRWLENCVENVSLKRIETRRLGEGRMAGGGGVGETKRKVKQFSI